MRKTLDSRIIKSVIAAICCSLLFSLFYNCFVDKLDTEPFDKKFKNVNRQLTLEIPKTDTYLLKIWGTEIPDKVFFNNRELLQFLSRKRREVNELYIRLDPSLINLGRNKLDIFSNKSYSVRIRNFYGATELGDIVVLFNRSKMPNFKLGYSFIIVAFQAFLGLLCLLFIIKELLKFCFENYNFDEFLSLFWRGNFSFFLVFAVFTISISLAGYRVLVFPSTFLGIMFILLFLLNSYLIIIFCLNRRKEIVINKPVLLIFNSVLSDKYKNYQSLTLDKFIYNSLTLDKFIYNFSELSLENTSLIFSLFMLIFCIPALFMRLNFLANLLFFIFYFCLIYGLFMRLKRYISENKK